MFERLFIACVLQPMELEDFDMEITIQTPPHASVVVSTSPTLRDPRLAASTTPIPMRLQPTPRRVLGEGLEIVPSAAENAPQVVLGSETWHGQVPVDWVPIITRDAQGQRRQNRQPAYSDAYISGMPSKRRKIVAGAKPQGSLPQVISG